MNFEILQGILEIIQFILNVFSDKHVDGAWDNIWKKSIKGTFIALQMKSFGPQKVQIMYMKGLKKCPDSTTLKNPLLEIKNYFSFGFLWIPSNAERQN